MRAFSRMSNEKMIENSDNRGEGGKWEGKLTRQEKVSLVLRVFSGANVPVYSKMRLSCVQNTFHYLLPTGDGTESQKSNDSPEPQGQKVAGGTRDPLYRYMTLPQHHGAPFHVSGQL